MVIPELIIHERIKLNENQEQFAKRFGVNANTVSRWESGVNEAPYKVINFILGEMFLYTPQMDAYGRIKVRMCECKRCETLLTLEEIIKKGYKVIIEA